MRRLADQPNIVSKLSGLGTFIQRNDPSHIANVIHETVSIFGPDRCLFGSNFPIEKLLTNYADLVADHRAVLSAYGPKWQRAMLHDNAVRVYKLTGIEGKIT